MNAVNIFNLVMTLLYLSIGVFILFNPASKYGFSDFNWAGIGIISTVYGFFRIYTLFRKKDKTEVDEDEEY